MFWATMCPSSGEIIVSMRHLVFVTLCGWLSGRQGGIHSTLHSYVCPMYRMVDGKGKIKLLLIYAKSIIDYVETF
jgi:hypothetical protein